MANKKNYRYSYQNGQSRGKFIRTGGRLVSDDGRWRISYRGPKGWVVYLDGKWWEKQWECGCGFGWGYGNIRAAIATVEEYLNDLDENGVEPDGTDWTEPVSDPSMFCRPKTDPPRNFAVVAEYGKNDIPEYYTIAIQDGGIKHGGQIIATAVFKVNEFSGCEELRGTIEQWSAEYDIKEMFTISGQFEPEMCGCGEPSVRVLD